MSDKIEFYLRIANKLDAENIFILSNEESVRENSINPEPILWEDHQKWFNNTLESDTSLILVAIDKNNQFIGQIYFEIDNNISLISISIKEDYRGMDLAAPIISESAKFLFSQNNHIEAILAYIKEINIPSLKAFEQAGYLYYKHEIINDTKFYVYKYLKN